MEFKLYLIIIILAIGKEVDASGSFFQRIDKYGETSTDGEQMVTSENFHQCSIENNCNFLAISNDDKIFHKATTKGKLPELPKQQIWKKVLPVFKSCKDAMANGHTESGIINLRLANGSALPVYCDMTTDGGGWIVFQKRHNSSVNFQRDWITYKNGFGDLAGNFWLGLKALHYLLTTTKTNGGGKWMLRVDLKSSDGDQGYAKYTDFNIGSAQENYTMTYGTYSGNVGDAMLRSKGYAFSTYDKDNDIDSYNCAQYYKGGWWYSGCFDANLNNRYPGTGTTQIPDNSDFMSWKQWKGRFGNIVFSEMKIKEESLT